MMMLKPGTYDSLPHKIRACPDLSPAAKLAWTALYGRLGNNDNVWPGMRKIAQDIGLSKSRVEVVIDELVDIGLINILKKVSGRQQFTYTFNDVDEWADKYAQRPAGKPSHDTVTSSGVDGGKVLKTPKVSSGVDGGVQRSGRQVSSGQDGVSSGVDDSVQRTGQNHSINQPKEPNQGETTQGINSLSAASQQREVTTPVAPLDNKDEDCDIETLVLDGSMVPATFITLVHLWKKQVGPLTLTKEKLALLLRAIQKEEQLSGVTLNPQLVMKALADRPGLAIAFSDLWHPRDGKFFWVTLQAQASMTPLQEIEQVITTTKKKAAPRNHLSDADAEKIYQSYPRKVGKGAAIKAIHAAITLLRDAADPSIPDPVAYLLERTQLFARSEAGNKGTYTPHPATWFNQLRYRDDEKEWNPTPKSRTGNVVSTPDDPNPEPYEAISIDTFKQF